MPGGERLTESLTVQLSPSQLAKIRATAEAEERTMGWIVRRLIDEGLMPKPSSKGQ